MGWRTAKSRSLILLVVAEILAMAVWFSAAAVLADMVAETPITGMRQALLSSSVQAGFALGAVIYAILGLADRFDPRLVFFASTLGAALSNAALLWVPIGSDAAILARLMTGALLAGVYPVGMKIAVGWGTQDRGLLVGLLVGAVTLGTATPHLLAFWGGADWRSSVGLATVLAILGGSLVFGVRLGPHHVKAPRFDPSHLKQVWRDQRIRAAYGGYLGHMWELYAFWAWISVALTAAFAARMDAASALALAKMVAFAVIGIGAVASVLAGFYGDRVGKANSARLAMMGSGSAAVLAALAYAGPIWLLIIIVLIWGAFVIADSAQFSALVADFAPPEATGALLTLQTALGFALTVVTVQITPWIASLIGWPGLFILLALGPAFGVVVMSGLRERNAPHQ